MEPWRRLDEAAASEARVWLRRCCGSTRWVDGMLARRPFGSNVALLGAARVVWNALDENDWLEAFAHHPQIGARDPSAAPADTRETSQREQAGVADAPSGVRHALDEGNREYALKFGYIFIVCAAGRSAESMLTDLRRRLQHDAATEIQIAAEEQAQITALRLQALT
ncbi:MAG TPA: 2-oxo-4-hydroxy-4-carboxy-5-ureidoimidazoline decarboxylase [Vicinamibacterales bacterium]|nr:2-oxo-4-hydroxy-4-carboxy-5-ureidoimidazoline decarboxylase [Vicinamibacterales bacterium]